MSNGNKRTVRKDGRVTIPPPFAAQLGLKPGTEVEWTLVGDQLILRKAPEQPKEKEA